MVTVTDTEANRGTDAVAALKERVIALGITQDRIAKAAGVTRPMVVNVFAGRRRSANVMEAVQRLIVQAERRVARKIRR